MSFKCNSFSARLVCWKSAPIHWNDCLWKSEKGFQIYLQRKRKTNRFCKYGEFILLCLFLLNIVLLFIIQLGLPKEFQKLNYYIGKTNIGPGDSGGPMFQIISMQIPLYFIDIIPIFFKYYYQPWFLAKETIFLYSSALEISNIKGILISV